jgi:hypothetical protein
MERVKATQVRKGTQRLVVPAIIARQLFIHSTDVQSSKRQPWMRNGGTSKLQNIVLNVCFVHMPDRIAPLRFSADTARVLTITLSSGRKLHPRRQKISQRQELKVWEALEPGEVE